MTKPEPAPETRCTLCMHREDQHDTLPDGTRPCRSIGHEKGLTCAECRRLIGDEHFEALMRLRGEDDDAFTDAWAAYYVTLNHVRDQIGPGWQAFFSDVHQSALASAVITLRTRSNAEVGERLALALEARDRNDPAAFCCERCSGDSLPPVAEWLRANAAAILSAPPDAPHFTEQREYRVIGEGWGKIGAATESEARKKVHDAVTFRPPIAAHAEWRAVRTWPDGARYTTAWKPLPDSEA